MLPTRSGLIRQGSVTGRAARRPEPLLEGGNNGIEKAHLEGCIPQTDVANCRSNGVDIFNCNRQPNQHDCDCGHIRSGLGVLVCGEAVFVTRDAKGAARDPKLFAADRRDVGAPGNICIRRGRGPRLDQVADARSGSNSEVVADATSALPSEGTRRSAVSSPGVGEYQLPELLFAILGPSIAIVCWHKIRSLLRLQTEVEYQEG
jgi:hypothetical protein